MKEFNFNNIIGQKLEDIGRLMFENQFEEGLTINEFDGEVFLKFESHTLILKPFPTTEGDRIFIYEYDAKNDKKKVSFSLGDENVIFQRLENICLVKNGELLNEVRFIFENLSLDVSLNHSDELVIMIHNLLIFKDTYS